MQYSEIKVISASLSRNSSYNTNDRILYVGTQACVYVYIHYSMSYITEMALKG